ncbi:MAG: methyltransferase family protein [Candidatus Acidiferrum sp.]
MPAYAFAILALGWFFWLLPFFLVNKQKQTAKKLDKRARWGILFIFIAYSLLWQGHFWERTLQSWRFAASALFLLLAVLLSWTGTRALGKQWRLDAGLIADHELVTSGPYRFVRHPIYTSMFCTLLGTGILITPWWLLLPAVLFFIVGTEIRMRVEDNLLASQFGEQFAQYKRVVPAYIPFLR